MRRIRVLQRSAAVAALLLAACTLAACAGGGGEIRYFLLDPVPASPLASAPIDLRVVDVEVPQYLERFQIARRADDNRIAYAMNDQWGEPLRENLLRVLSANLGDRLSTDRVSTPLARLEGGFPVELTVHLERFETDADGRAALRARWQLGPVEAGAQPTTELLELRAERAAAGGVGGEVRALQDLFAELCDQIARGIVARQGAQGA